MLKEVADMIARPLSDLERSQHSGKLSEYWRKASTTLVFKAGKKEDPGSCRLVSLILTPEEVMKCFILETVSTHVVDKKMMSSQHT